MLKVQPHRLTSSPLPPLTWTRSSWLNCALRDDEAVYWVSLGHYEAVAVGNLSYWVSRGHLCLYILYKVEICSGITDALLTHSLTATRFSNSVFCHLGVNFFVFCRNLKTKTDLKSLCNFPIECGISKDLMIKFLPEKRKMLFFSVFDLIFLRVFSFLSVKDVRFLAPQVL